MNRKEFIGTCTLTCLGALGLSSLLQACSPAQYLQLKKEGDKLRLARRVFIRNEEGRHRRYVLVKSEEFANPIIVYRFSEDDYSALLLRCTHQGAELSVNGDLLSCAAHGSEFGTRGEVVQGPADENLKSFKIETDRENIYIRLA